MSNNNLGNAQIITNINTGQLIQLSTHLKEALKREESLEAKIESLEVVLAKASQSAAESWKSCVQEDRLLSRIESLQFKLESLLKAFSMKTNDDTVTYLKNEVVKLHDLKEKYEIEAKESVLLAQQSVCIAKANIGELEITLSSALAESERLTALNQGLSEQLTCLSEKYETLIADLEEMENKNKASEEFHAQQAKEFETEKYNLTSGYEAQIESLNDKIDSLEDEIARLKKVLDESSKMDNIKNLSNIIVKSRPISPLVIDDNRNESDQESFLDTNGDHGKNNLTNGIMSDNENSLVFLDTTSQKSLIDSNLHVSSPSLPTSSPNLTSQLKNEITLLKG